MVGAGRRLAFGLPIKALGFVAILEGTMALSKTPWLSATALVLLAVLNAVYAGTALALDHEGRGADR